MRNLQQFSAADNMERFEKMVEGFMAISHHPPEEMVAGIREFFSIQRKHYAKCSKAGLQCVDYATLHSDLLDRRDKFSTHVDRRRVDRIEVIPRWDDLPRGLAAAIVLREQQLKQILDAIRKERAGTVPSAPAVPHGAAPPASAPPTTPNTVNGKGLPGARTENT